jgi:hypothetical protein
VKDREATATSSTGLKNSFGARTTMFCALSARCPRPTSLGRKDEADQSKTGCAAPAFLVRSVGQFSSESRPGKGGFCREVEVIQRRTDCGGVEAGRTRSAVGGATPTSGSFRTDVLSLEKQYIGLEGARSPAPTAPGRKHEVETIGRRASARQSYVEGGSLKKILEPSRRRQVVKYLHGSYRVSERRACRVAQTNRATFRCGIHKDPRTELRMRILEIAQTKVRYGYRNIRLLLNRYGWRVGKYLVERIYREEGLTLHQRRKRRRREAEHRRARFHPTGQTKSGRWTSWQISWPTEEDFDH